METEKDCVDGIDACDCPDGHDYTDAEREAKFKAYGIERVPIDDEWLETQRRKRYIRGRNAYLATLPPETEEDRLDAKRIIAEWDARVEKAFHEQAMRPLGIGEWNHDVPCVAPDCRKDGLTRAFELLGVEARYNTRSARAEIRHESFPEGWRNLNDRLAAELREVIAKRFVYEKKKSVLPIQAIDKKMARAVADGEVFEAEELDALEARTSLENRTKVETAPLRFGREAWVDTFNAYLYGREADPFAEWLDALPRWDGTERLGGWLPEVFTINDPNGLVEWAGRFILLGAVTRAYVPGSKLDEMPVLIGRGGIGKSTALRYILPPEMPGLFSDGLNLAGSPQERAEALQGRVIVEASELAGVSKADLASLKAFLSRTDDGAVRLAYRRDPELMLRRAIIVGTSDVESPLPNDRNLRRWAPVYLTGGNPGLLRKYLDANRVRLWAEAVYLYRQGAEARLPDTLVTEQVAATSRARSRDVVIEDAVEAYVANQTDGFTLAHLAESIGMIDHKKGSRLGMREQHRLGNVLDSMGFSKTQQRVGGVRKWIWNR